MILLKIENETAEAEAKEFERIINGGAIPASIYDDVDELQTKVNEITGRIDTLETAITGFLSSASENLNDKDLNECIGRIIIGYGNNCLNKPTGANGYLINIPHNSRGDLFNKQIWFCRPANAIYFRNMDNGTFGEWAKII